MEDPDWSTIVGVGLLGYLLLVVVYGFIQCLGFIRERACVTWTCCTTLCHKLHSSCRCCCRFFRTGYGRIGCQTLVALNPHCFLLLSTIRNIPMEQIFTNIVTFVSIGNWDLTDPKYWVVLLGTIVSTMGSAVSACRLYVDKQLGLSDSKAIREDSSFIFASWNRDFHKDHHPEDLKLFNWLSTLSPPTCSTSSTINHLLEGRKIILAGLSGDSSGLQQLVQIFTTHKEDYLDDIEVLKKLRNAVSNVRNELSESLLPELKLLDACISKARDDCRGVFSRESDLLLDLEALTTIVGNAAKMSKELLQEHEVGSKPCVCVPTTLASPTFRPFVTPSRCLMDVCFVKQLLRATQSVTNELSKAMMPSRGIVESLKSLFSELTRNRVEEDMYQPEFFHFFRVNYADSLTWDTWRVPGTEPGVLDRDLWNTITDAIEAHPVFDLFDAKFQTCLSDLSKKVPELCQDVLDRLQDRKEIRDCIESSEGMLTAFETCVDDGYLLQDDLVRLREWFRRIRPEHYKTKSSFSDWVVNKPILTPDSHGMLQRFVEIVEKRLGIGRSTMSSLAFWGSVAVFMNCFTYALTTGFYRNPLCFEQDVPSCSVDPHDSRAKSQFTSFRCCLIPKEKT